MPKAGPKPDLTEFYELSNPRRNNCAIVKVLAELDEEARAQVEAALADPAVGHNGISHWLKKHRSVHLDGTTIGRHRKRRCKCPGLPYDQ